MIKVVACVAVMQFFKAVTDFGSGISKTCVAGFKHSPDLNCHGPKGEEKRKIKKKRIMLQHYQAPLIASIDCTHFSTD